MTDISAIGPKVLRSLTLCTAVLGYTMQNVKVYVTKCTFISCITVKLPIVDPPRKGHCIKSLSTVDSSRDRKILFPYSSTTI